jgi:predicted NAD/FAD-binding protein
MKIAVVGAGVSGLVAAYLLNEDHEVTVFEAGAHAGGHARTVDAEMDGAIHPVDVGFVVFNETTYPSFVRLLGKLGVASRPTSMSFGVRCDRTGIEYCGTSLDTVFAQRRNLVRPSFLRMLRDILRFNREAKELLDLGIAAPTLGELVRERGYSREFLDHYLVPMVAAIWSADPDKVADFPALFFVRFFRNHGLLGVDSHLPWRVVQGGSRRYVEALTRSFGDRIRLSTPVRSVTRAADFVTVVPESGPPERFDHAILATHADQALDMLTDAAEREREILRAFPSTRNEGVLHTDASVLPSRRKAWASWNYRLPETEGGRVAVTYDITRLQGLATREPFCLSLNPTVEIDPALVLRRFSFEHPLYTPASISAQGRHGEISGTGRTHFAGAYWGNGFHEDGVASALAVCRRFGKTL